MISHKQLLEICQQEKIIFEKVIRQSKRFLLIKGFTEEENVSLKVLIDLRRKYAKKSLIKEAETLELLNNLEETNIRAPKFFGENFKKKYPYYKKEFILGETLESKSGFFFKKLSRNEIFQIIEILKSLRGIPLPLLKKSVSNLSDFGKGHFDFTLKLHQKEINLFLKREQIKQLPGLIKKAEQVLALNNKVAVHGEVYPDNIIKNKKGEIFLLDWENIGIGNPAHDAVSVYLKIKEESLRQFFLKKLNFSKEKFFPLFFQLELILQSLGCLHYIKEISKENKYYIKKYENFICRF